MTTLQKQERQFTAKEISDAKRICSQHNRYLPAIKELRSELNLGLIDAKSLCDKVYDEVSHPQHVDYDNLDRRPPKLVLQDLHMEQSETGQYLVITRSDLAQVKIKVSKKLHKSLIDFGVRG